MRDVNKMGRDLVKSAINFPAEKRKTDRADHK